MPQSLSTTSDVIFRRAITAFRIRFGANPEIVGHGPGRVNIIGDHTDYQNGFVFPMAIECLNETGIYTIVSNDLDQEITFHEPMLEVPDNKRSWYSYAFGTVACFFEEVALPYPSGFNLLICSSLPIGSGLSSSAAMEVAIATALEGSTGKHLSPIIKAENVCQRAEHTWADMPCGLMDQVSSIMGKKGFAMLFDCRSKKTIYIPIPETLSILVIFCGISHFLTDGHYKQRTLECAEALRLIRKKFPQINSLRDLTTTLFESSKDLLDDILLLRVKHIMEENKRVLEFIKQLKLENFIEAGKLMYDSHTSLKDQHCVTIPELDAIVDIARTIPEIYGARMMGGGFGGSVGILLDKNNLEFVKKKIMILYQYKFDEIQNKKKISIKKKGIPSCFEAIPSNGASIYNSNFY